MTEVLNPVLLEEHLQRLVTQIAKGVPVVSAAHTDWKSKQHAFEVAYARAYVGSTAPAHERRYIAVLATVEEASAAEVAEVVFRNAERQMRALEGELSAYQTMAKNVTAMYGAAGSGRGQ